MNQQTFNVDPAEINKFEALASRWWDRNSEFKTLHDINPMRLEYIQSYANGLEGKRTLDVGCGGGILSESMAASGATVTGIDLGAAPLEVAKLHTLESGLDIDYQQIAVEELAKNEPSSFDVVTCMEMLEHVPDPASIVNACAKLVKPGGYVFFSTINRNPKAYLFAIVGAEYLLRMLPKGTHDFAKFIRPSELGRWCRQNDLHTLNLKGLSYNPLTGIYALGNDTSVNYLLACQSENY